MKCIITEIHGVDAFHVDRDQFIDQEVVPMNDLKKYDGIFWWHGNVRLLNTTYNGRHIISFNGVRLNFIKEAE